MKWSVGLALEFFQWPRKKRVKVAKPVKSQRWQIHQDRAGTPPSPLLPPFLQAEVGSTRTSAAQPVAARDFEWPQIRHLWSVQPLRMATSIRPLRFADFLFFVGGVGRKRRRGIDDRVEKDQAVSVHLDIH